LIDLLLCNLLDKLHDLLRIEAESSDHEGFRIWGVKKLVKVALQGEKGF
jgi:hypothetical protein